MRNFKSLGLVLALLTIPSIRAQIGYQVTVLDTATGEPRANETITATITISDASGGTICSDVKTAATDEFGVLSLEVGNSGTFANVDWSKLPLYISATVDGVMIGRTQVLSVPVAEYAKQTGTLTKEILCSRNWTSKSAYSSTTIKFSNDNSFTLHCTTSTPSIPTTYGTSTDTYSGTYSISGDMVTCVDDSQGWVFTYSSLNNCLVNAGDLGGTYK